MACGAGDDYSLPEVEQYGYFLDAPVQGLTYRTSKLSGTTDQNGGFKYYQGESITFMIGPIVLGTGIAKSTMSPIDLVPSAINEMNPEVTNRCRLLMTLDLDGNPNNGILLSSMMSSVIGNDVKPIDFSLLPEDFTDDNEMINYVLNTLKTHEIIPQDRKVVSEESAQSHLRQTLFGQINVLSITPLQISIPTGQTFQFIATGQFSNQQALQDCTSQVIWYSSHDSIASISNEYNNKGVVTALMPGTCRIGASLDGIIQWTDITVTDVTLVSIDITPSNPKIPLLLEQEFLAFGVYSDGQRINITQQVTWSSSDLSIATLSQSSTLQSLIKPVQVGKTIIQASMDNIKGQTTLTIQDTQLTAITIYPGDSVIPKGRSIQLLANGLFDNHAVYNITKYVEWDSLDKSVAIIGNGSQNKGKISTVSPGATTIKATYIELSDSVSIRVTEKILETITMLPTNPIRPILLPLSFSARAIYSDDTSQNITNQVIWRSENDSIVEMSIEPNQYGWAIPISPGTTDIQIEYEGKSFTTAMTVTDAVLKSIRISPAHVTIPLTQKTFQFTAIATFSDQVSYDITTLADWFSTNTTHIQINTNMPSKGQATPMSDGNASIYATFQGVSGQSSVVVTSSDIITKKKIQNAIIATAENENKVQ